MADTNLTSHTPGALEALQNNSAQHRRLRPPDLDMIVGDESRIPLRVEQDKEKEKEKLGRRESKLGLRSIFGRYKATNEVEGTPSIRELPPRGGGIRASLADISNWPYTFHMARSEVTLPTVSQSPRPLSTATAPPQATHHTTRANRSVPARSKTPVPSPTSRHSRGSLATWDPPPLFKSYPQAIKHAQLPACTTSPEVLLRHHGSSSLRDGFAVSDASEDASKEKTAEKVKRKHRRSMSASSLKLDWTTKIYVLVTSGYLLQYAGDGSFDRLPEKILNIGKDSAAFASDVIPGKHWVLQVSSAIDPDGTHAPDSKSLFSRLPFRGSERRQASTFLMVFESAEDMESWIATLRREIEHLGGKKNLSETGKPKADDHVVQLRAQPSQRTLVVRDPDRFSRVTLPEFPPNQDRSSGSPDVQFEAGESDSFPEGSFDDVSTTNSLVSQDGRQLDSLRDSSNRLSFVSSGQRTIVTSEASSPPCSPARDSFASQTDEPPYSEPSQLLPPETARRRPNAAEILDRRQSMQTMNQLVDVRIASAAPPRPLSTYSTPGQDGPHPYSPPVQTIPNFSVPHSMGKRYSLIKTPPMESPAAMSPPLSARGPPARPRRPPPPSLGFSRPLSIVADQPSPISTSPSVGTIKDVFSSPASEAADGHSISASWGQLDGQAPPSNDSELSSRNSSMTQIQVVVHTSPKRHSSLQALRPLEPSSESRGETRRFILPGQLPPPRGAGEMTERYPRSKSSLDSYGRSRSRSPIPRMAEQAKYKRASMYSQPSEAAVPPSLAVPESGAGDLDPRDLPLGQSVVASVGTWPNLPRHSASNQHLRVNSSTKALFNRRSMPQLAEGPPPAPPPTCALPPIPRSRLGERHALGRRRHEF